MNFDYSIESPIPILIYVNNHYAYEGRVCVAPVVVLYVVLWAEWRQGSTVSPRALCDALLWESPARAHTHTHISTEGHKEVNCV